MKNVLFASTALVAFGFAGAAFADAHASTAISLKGSAELAFTSVDDGTAANDGHIQLRNDFDLTWSLTGTTDGGLKFGASGDWDEDLDQQTTAFISGSFGTITIGDTDGAYDKAMIEIASAGLNDEADFYVEQHSGLDGTVDAEDQVGRWDIAFGGTTLSLSYEDGDDAPGSEDAVGVGAAFSFGNIGMGIGYQEAGDANVAGISVSASLGSVALVAAYEAGESAAGVDNENFGVSAVFDLGGGSFGINYDHDEDDGTEDLDGYGIWYSMSLGGGATFTAAAGTNEGTSAAGAAVDETRFGAGIGMSF